MGVERRVRLADMAGQSWRHRSRPPWGRLRARGRPEPPTVVGSSSWQYSKTYIGMTCGWPWGWVRPDSQRCDASSSTPGSGGLSPRRPVC